MTQSASWFRATQTTLAEPAHFLGVGLHSGRTVSMTVRPSGPYTGVIFLRKDLPQGQGLIPARWYHVVDTRLCTVIGNASGATVSTVEHFLAALAICGIDNAVVEVDGPELPIMDGSATPFVAALQKAGQTTQNYKRHGILIQDHIVVRSGDKVARLSPHSGWKMTAEIEFANSAVGSQRFTIDALDGENPSELLPARTFGFADEIAALRAQGLAQGGSLFNAVLVNNEGVVNPEGLRFPDEFVRHKLLDAVGDLYLAGLPIVGQFWSRKPGHQLNNLLLKQLFADRHKWSFVALDELDQRKKTAAFAAEDGTPWHDERRIG